MTRTYALKRLLEHGPLAFGSLVAITGWTSRQVASALQAMEKSGALQIDGRRKRMVYRIAE